MVQEEALEAGIDRLLADPAYEGHPLRAALAALYEQYRDQLAQVERITAISDGYQSVLMERNQSLTQRYRRHLRKLEKIVRISDQYQAMLRELNESLKRASSHDALTGLPNRRSMLEWLRAEEKRVQRGSDPFSIGLLDADDFKGLNDTLGHDVGDNALVALGAALQGSLRASDRCCRWGGEEFMVLLPETTAEGAAAMAERLRAAVAESRDGRLPEGARLTVSGGVAVHRPPEAFGETIKRADLALFEAKNGGRNRIVAAG